MTHNLYVKQTRDTLIKLIKFRKDSKILGRTDKAVGEILICEQIINYLSFYVIPVSSALQPLVPGEWTIKMKVFNGKV